MTDNSYVPWSKEDIDTLDKLYRNDLTLEQISKVLGRSPRAIEHALKNILVQQLVHTNPRRVSSKYNISYETMEQDLTPLKYYIRDTSQKSFMVIVYVLVMYMLVVAIGLMIGGQ